MSQPLIFDRKLLRNNRDRAAKSLDNFEFLLETALHRLTDRLLDLKRSFDLVMNLGGRTGSLEKVWPVELNKPAFIHTDISQKMAFRARLLNPAIVCDEEFLPFLAESVDAVISCLSLHWANDLPGAFQQIRQTLKPDGLCLTSIWGGQTLFELREALSAAELELKHGVSPRISPFTTLQDLAHLMQRAGFALPVADTDKIIVKYDDIFQLMRDLRGMGETNIIFDRSKQPLHRSVFIRANEIYQEKFGDQSSKLPATFEILTGTGWAPHTSQQQPLKPGSGSVHLSKILG